ncbi:putative sulfate exporter family transporter [Shewanella sp. C32]|uniref:Sulfate exporter family transporter n=1 Tax=Shewanella electrica TaxID=515560 RepID=A0ABT2FP68_9GAMM|nr:putative sulfate exporter family transporter [Shewanella electrica]MCH1925963.1 putative sulfate exporter family transporter [Shewanella electrica]MCS4557430.1 putative sulfate exporter family transporter [Shewanella electrica]
MLSSATLQPRYRKALFLTLALICFLPAINSPTALILGFMLANVVGMPQDWQLGAVTKKLLSLSIICLGFGIPFSQAQQVTLNNLPLILGSIIATIVIGTLLAKLFKLERNTGHLIACGTAICGGSAIAAVAPAINAKNDQTALALACVFVLNSIALFIFPLIGHMLDLSQQQFGVWSAIAIHDTSSVVGAASAYGEEALKTATTIKLARALWIVPVAALSAMWFGGERKLKVPAFIVYYCLAIAISSLLPQGQLLYDGLFIAGKRLLIVCLFLVGCGITISKLRSHGTRPLVSATLLWIAIACGSLSVVLLTRS